MTAMTFSRALLAGAAAFLTIGATSGASAQEANPNDVFRCGAPIGVLAVAEPQTQWWRDYNLGSPEALIKVFVSRSGCFTLVDRGRGLDMAQQERELASGGNLRVGSNVGAGQVVAADYVLLPDLVSSNENASGRNIGGLLGGLVGGGAGAIIAGINIRDMTADVTLTLTDVRSTMQLAVIDGHADKTNIGFGAGGGIFSGGGFGALGASGYDNTEVGQVITMAYLQAYNKMVDQLGGVAATGGAAAAPQQAVRMTRAGTMYSQPSTQSQVVRPVDQGMLLYPTGNRDGLMWEVQDELGNFGWVSSITFELAR
jgi:curli biogenesis system outer membrane secretion channel CsgG